MGSSGLLYVWCLQSSYCQTRGGCRFWVTWYLPQQGKLCGCEFGNLICVPCLALFAAFSLSLSLYLVVFWCEAMCHVCSLLLVALCYILLTSSLSCRVAVETFPVLAVHPHTLAAHLQIAQETHWSTMWSFCSREHSQCCRIISLLVDPPRLVVTQLCEWKGSPLLVLILAPVCPHLHNLDFGSWRTQLAGEL